MSVLLSFTKFLLIASTATILSLCYLYIETGKCTSPPLLRSYNVMANVTHPITHPMPNITRQPTSCSCPRSGNDLTDYVNKDKFNEIFKRRAVIFEQDLIRKKSTKVLNELLLAPSNSPLQYPIQGFTISPLKKGIIPGTVTLSVSSGVLAVESLQEKDEVEGQGEKVLSISASSLQSLNDLLGRVSYRSIVYSVKSGDLVHFNFEQYKAIFPVVIRQQGIPVLYDIGNDINSQVTITTKTFLRYPEVNYLIKSIREFYKDIKIIIADDSFNTQKVKGDHIEQYFMPPAQGWFAGRNLAVSQVTTKYFLWVDDDFYFTENTKLEKFVEIMESKPELDVVAGSVNGIPNSFTLHYDEGDEDGGCLIRVKGTYQPIPEIPTCYYASGVINFFLARTDAIRRVGFDPRLKRVGHSEVFMDGLGELLVAICPDIGCNHQRRRLNPLYNKFRKPGQGDTNMKLYLHFFKNRLKCMKW